MCVENVPENTGSRVGGCEREDGGGGGEEEAESAHHICLTAVSDGRLRVGGPSFLTKSDLRPMTTQ